jgi:hypothetical protein
MQYMLLHGVVAVTISKHNDSLCCNYYTYCNGTKKSLPKSIVTRLIATTANESDFAAIRRYCHKYVPVTTLFHRCNMPNF